MATELLSTTGRAWLEGELAKVVPLPTEEEASIWEHTYFGYLYPSVRMESKADEKRRWWRLARARWLEFLTARRRGEGFEAYARRTGNGPARAEPFNFGGPSKPAMPAGAFRVLGLPSTADAATIRAAWKRLAALHHPDRPGGDQARFIAITQARDDALAWVAISWQGEDDWSWGGDSADAPF